MAEGIGLVRNFTATTTAQRNTSALPAGDYIVRIDGSPCYVLQGTSTVTASSTTSHRIRDGDAWGFTVPTDWYSGTTNPAYLSVVAQTGTATVYVSRRDSAGLTTQPPTWA